MIVVVDASVALKWFMGAGRGEVHVDKALKLLEDVASGALDLVQPPHFVAEVAAVLARLKPDGALEDLLDLQQIQFRVLDRPEVHATALDLAISFKCHVFDTLYHAVALHTPGAVLVTADLRYLRLARPRGQVVALADFVS